MANQIYFWVPVSGVYNGSWNSTDSSHWSLSSGGSGGAGIPDSTDDVVFNQSTAYTVTTSGNIFCKNFTVNNASSSGPSFTGTGTLEVSGSLVSNHNTLIRITLLRFTSTSTGNSIALSDAAHSVDSDVEFTGVGGSWIFNNNFNMTSNKGLTLLAGTLNLSGNKITCGQFVSSTATNVRSVNFNSGTVNITGVKWQVNANNLSYTGTGTIIFTTASASTFAGAGMNYPVTLIHNMPGALTITGSNTFTKISSQVLTGADVVTAATTPPSIIFTANTTTTVTDWAVYGFYHAVYNNSYYIYYLNIKSSTIGTKYNIVKTGGGYAYSYYNNITDSNVTPTNTWYNTSSSSLNSSTGWNTTNSRYWVSNGSSYNGTWDTTDTSHWAIFSGGTPGAPPPVSADDVYFDASATYTVALDAAADILCNNFTVTNSTGVVSFSSAVTPKYIQCQGSISIPQNTDFIGVGRTYLYLNNTTNLGSFTINTNNCPNIQGLVIATGTGNPVTYTLSSPLNLNNAYNFSITGPVTFDTNSYNLITQIQLYIYPSASPASPLTLKFGSSQVTWNDSYFMTASNTNYVFDAGTSTMNLPFAGWNTLKGLTFYNVSVRAEFSYYGSALGETTAIFKYPNVFNNLTFTGNSTNTIGRYVLGANQTINGNFTVNPTSTNAVRRQFIRSNQPGTSRTISVAGTVSIANTDFQDITISGQASPVSVAYGGDCGNNNGFSFPAAKTVYLNGTNSGSGTLNIPTFSDNNWCTSTDGGVTFSSPSYENFPLVQDTIRLTDSSSTNVFDNHSLYNIGTIDFSTRTTSFTFTSSITFPLNIYGDVFFGTGVTIDTPLSSTPLNIVFGGSTNNTRNFNHGNKINNKYVNIIIERGNTGSVSFDQNYIAKINGTLRISAGQVYLYDNTFYCNCFDDRMGNYNTYVSPSARINLSTSIHQRSLIFGSTGTLVLDPSTTSTTIFERVSDGATSCVIYGTGTIKIAGTAGLIKTFISTGDANFEKITLEFAATGTTNIQFGNNATATFYRITNSVYPTTISLQNTGMTINVWRFTLKGIPTKLVTLSGLTNNTINKINGGIVDTNYLSLTNSKVTGACWYAGYNTTNVSGNTGWLYRKGPNDIFAFMK